MEIKQLSWLEVLRIYRDVTRVSPRGITWNVKPFKGSEEGSCLQPGCVASTLLIFTLSLSMCIYKKTPHWLPFNNRNNLDEIL